LGQRVEAAATYFAGALEAELIIPIQAHIGDCRIKTRGKKIPAGDVCGKAALRA